MKKILLSLATIGTVALMAFGLTSAFFSDTETSQGNVLQAGELDLKIDNESYYNGVLNEGTTWTLEEWINQLFFDFTDIKPDDYGEDTISLHAENDYWACMEIQVTKDDDNNCTEPEKLDDGNCGFPDAEPNANQFDGELGGLLNFVWWPDDGDNVLETDEEPFLGVATASSVLNSSVTLADSASNLWGPPGPPLPGGTPTYIGKAWCFGNMGLAALVPGEYPDGPAGDNDGDQLDEPGGTPEDGGFTCDGTGLNNASQTDVLMGDIKFSAYQARNNPNFTCEPQVSVTPTPTPTPTTPIACPVDVMLVLDRSGSINSTELGQLKTAAKQFVDDMGLSLSGIHAGQSSFATTGSLDHHLDFNSVTLKAAIDALIATGFTNLKEGIDLAAGELANPGDLHDRPDITSPDKMVIITDGHPNRPLPSSTADDVAATSASSFKSGGGEIFVVGVGSDVNTAYLQNDIASPGDYYSVSDYSGLQETLKDLDVCD
jgi:predicted ribosomally synthesized peptide with SipW-like signal peptide